MGYYDEDFYNVPSEFDIQVDEFKTMLSSAVRDEFKNEMERLRNENMELQEVKRSWESIQREYSAKHRQLEMDKQNMQRQVRRERLDTLMKDFQVIMYRADSKREVRPKCEKCDERRRRKYTTPLGREAFEDCECAKGKLVYYPAEHKLCEFRLDHNGTRIITWYKPYRDGEDGYVSAESAKVIYEDGMDYKELNSWLTFFKTKESCQAYCDYLIAAKDGDQP